MDARWNGNANDGIILWINRQERKEQWVDSGFRIHRNLRRCTRGVDSVEEPVRLDLKDRIIPSG